jgi:hypothetical protein
VEFDPGSKHSKELIGYRGEGEGNVIGGMDKEREFQKGYTHNVEIWKKNRAKAK